MALGSSKLGSGGLGGANLGSAGLRKDEGGPTGPFVQINSPPADSDVYNYTAWSTSGSGPREARINGGPWVSLSGGLFSSFVLDFYTILEDAAVTLEVRLTDDILVTDSRTFNKKVPVAPARQPYDLRFGGDTVISVDDWILPAGAVNIILEFNQEPGPANDNRLYWFAGGDAEGNYASVTPGDSVSVRRNGVKDTTVSTTVETGIWHVLSADFTAGSLVTLKIDDQSGESLTVGAALLASGLVIGSDGSPAGFNWLGGIRNLEVQVAGMPIYGLLVDDNSNVIADWAGGRPGVLTIGTGSWARPLPLIESPSEGEGVVSTTIFEVDAYIPTEIQVNTSPWGTYVSPVTLGSVAGASFPDLAGDPVACRARHISNHLEVSETNCVRFGATNIDSPVLNAVVVGSDELQITADGGGIRVSADAGQNWFQVSAGGGIHTTAFSNIPGFPASGGAFTVESRLLHTDDPIYSDFRAFVRSYEIAFTDPAVGAPVDGTDTFTLTSLGGTQEVKLSTEATWVDYTGPGQQFDTLFNWAGTANGAVIVEARSKEDTRQTTSRAFDKQPPVTPSVSIDSPSAGSVVGNETVVVLSFTSQAELQVFDVDGNPGNVSAWTNYVPGIMLEDIGIPGYAAGAALSLRARLVSDTGVTDSKSYTLTDIDIVQPAAGSDIEPETEIETSGTNNRELTWDRDTGPWTADPNNT